MNESTMTNLERAERYVRAIERGAMGAELAAYFAPHVVQEEFPNRIAPQGARRDLSALLLGAAKGQKLLAGQRYDIRRAVASGNQVALEIEWSGTLAVPLGSLAAGAELRAHLAVFLDFADGKIVSQHNYDCYEPF